MERRWLLDMNQPTLNYPGDLLSWWTVLLARTRARTVAASRELRTRLFP